MATSIARRLLDWYAGAARKLPWRGHPDPYAVWVSEIMLQQTRVETVIPYFERWMQRFPSVAALAAAGEQQVLQAWEGLGYYSRARNLHRAAQQVVAEHGGQLPQTRRELESLPGIGRYTAGAIASIAFGQDEPALDGNIRRVFARLYDVETPARAPEGERLLWSLVAQNLPAGLAGDFNQAVMDLGATICTPRAPACGVCPVAAHCLARERGTQELRPVLPARKAVPHLTVTAAVIERGGELLLARRPAEGLLGGLWEFPGGKLEPGETLEQCLRREIQEELGVDVQVGSPFGVYEHAYTHFRVTLHAFRCRLNGGRPQALHASEIRWVAAPALGEYPMGKIDRQIARRVLKEF
ncbi:MAG TPA: A/G-specific adenine glycosylase [Anaerolineaceae bacterium]|nr:A/G-specific adenine glycosylase [Anaerolineaceae bacterium]